MNERELQKVILEYLKLKGHFALRINTGAFAGEYRGKKRFFRSAPKGTPDIIGIKKGTGTLFAIEVKGLKGKVHPEQEEMLDSIRRNGALGIVARDIKDVQLAGL